MKKKFKIIIRAANLAKLISRILIIFNRRNIDVLYLNVAPLENPQEMRYTLEVESFEENIDKLVKQIEKQIGVISTLYQESDKENFTRCVKQGNNSLHSGYIQN